MFSAKSRKAQRERRVRDYFAMDPGIGLVLAAVNFEWTVSRGILFLSNKPNKELRALIEKCHGLGRYESFWNSEIAGVRGAKPLAQVVVNWPSVQRAFDMRHLLVHGRDGCTKKDG